MRIICATNKDLAKMVAEKTFREDFYYRIAVIPLPIPPLRERREDIPLLAHHFLARYNARAGASKTLSAEAMQKLGDHHWPGNVRELENMVEQAAALSVEAEIRAEDVSLDEGGPLPPPPDAEGEGRTLAAAVEEAERRTVEAALARCEGDLTRVARDLGVSATTLWRKMKRLGLPSRGAPPG